MRSVLKGIGLVLLGVALATAGCSNTDSIPVSHTVPDDAHGTLSGLSCVVKSSGAVTVSGTIKSGGATLTHGGEDDNFYVIAQITGKNGSSVGDGHSGVHTLARGQVAAIAFSVVGGTATSCYLQLALASI